MRRTKLTLILSAVIGAGVVAYASRAEPVRRVGEHEFKIPAERLFDARIFWLPKPNPGGFSFILDFPADPKLIPPHIVLVQSKKAVCRAGQAQMIRVACGSENSAPKPAPPYAKVFLIRDYSFSWDYYSARETGGSDEAAQLQVAYCTPISPNPARPSGTAICRTVWAVGDMILSLGFEESELNALPARRDRATAMLASWEVR